MSESESAATTPKITRFEERGILQVIPATVPCWVVVAVHGGGVSFDRVHVWALTDSRDVELRDGKVVYMGRWKRDHIMQPMTDEGGWLALAPADCLGLADEPGDVDGAWGKAAAELEAARKRRRTRASVPDARPPASAG